LTTRLSFPDRPKSTVRSPGCLLRRGYALQASRFPRPPFSLLGPSRCSDPDYPSSSRSFRCGQTHFASPQTIVTCGALIFLCGRSAHPFPSPAPRSAKLALIRTSSFFSLSPRQRIRTKFFLGISQRTPYLSLFRFPSVFPPPFLPPSPSLPPPSAVGVIFRFRSEADPNRSDFFSRFLPLPPMFPSMVAFFFHPSVSTPFLHPFSSESLCWPRFGLSLF